MPKEKDLRYIKTEALIEETYLKLKKQTHSPVKVSDLCRAALINKTTFYSHYETMEALHRHICEKEIDKILSSAEYIDAAFTETEKFIESLIGAFKAHADTVISLFGSEAENIMLLKTIEENILRRYLGGSEPPEEKMKMVFAIGGAARLLLYDQNPEKVSVTVELIKKIFEE